MRCRIKEAVEKAFEVTVIDVNTMVVRGKVKRFGRGSGQQPDRKMAIVRLAAGVSIELFEGVSLYANHAVQANIARSAHL